MRLARAHFFPAAHQRDGTLESTKPSLPLSKLNAPYTLQLLAQYTFSRPHTKGMADLVEKTIVVAIQTPRHSDALSKMLAQYTLSQPHWQDHPELVELLDSKR